jgi:hypothetical protein
VGTPSQHLASIGIGAASAVAALGCLGWWGLQVRPAPFPPLVEQPTDSGTVVLPANLPAPVARYAQAVFGGNPRVADSAIIAGRGKLRLGPVVFPTRFRFISQGGRNYRHYIECTWFGMPVLRVNEWYRDGHLRQQLPIGTVANEPKADRAANLALWGEMVWLPSVFLTDPRIRWERIDAESAALVVPSGRDEDRLTVTFNAQTGLVESITALRYRSPHDQTKTPWRVEFFEWADFEGVRAPSSASLTWLDQGRPWFVMQVEQVVYNTDVSQSITASGP